MKLRVDNPLGWLTLAFISFLFHQTVLAAPLAIVTQPASQYIIVNSNASFTVSTTGGQGAITYQWGFNGTNLANSGRISGAASTNLMISGVTAADVGSYKVTVTDNHGPLSSSNVTLTVLFPPAITNQPVDATVLLGSNASFTVTAGGTAPLAYQWQTGGVDLSNGGIISGADNATLNFSGVQTNDAGLYQVVVTNSYGSVTSAVATLTVLVPATIVMQPANQTGLLLKSVTFNVNAAGNPPLIYQWQKNGTNLPEGGQIYGVSGPVLTVSNLLAADAGNYRVVVSNLYGATISTEASLAIVPVAAWGGDNFFGVNNLPLTLTNPLAFSAGYQRNLAISANDTVLGWGSNYEPVMPAGLSNVVAVSAGLDFALALKSDGTVAGWGYSPFGESSPPAGLTNVVAIAAGYSHSLALKRDGTVVAWGWNNGGTAVPGNLTNVIAITAGSDSGLALKSDGTLTAWGNNGSGQSNIPSGIENIVGISSGGYHNLALKSDGTILAWGWNYFGQTNIPTALSNVVGIAAGHTHNMALKKDGTLTAWGSNDSGESNVPAGLNNVVAIEAGGAHNLAMVQNMNSAVPPAIWWEGFTNRILPSGKTTVLLPVITGSLPMDYQWFFNGTPLAGETNKWLVLSSILPEQAGNYHFVVSNSFGSATSAMTAVFESPGILQSPVSQSTLTGSNVTFSASVLGIGPLNHQWLFNGTPLADGGRVSGSTTTNLTIANL